MFQKDVFVRLLCNVLLSYYTLYFTNNLENGVLMICLQTLLSRKKIRKIKQQFAHPLKLLKPSNLSVKVEGANVPTYSEPPSPSPNQKFLPLPQLPLVIRPPKYLGGREQTFGRILSMLLFQFHLFNPLVPDVH